MVCAIIVPWDCLLRNFSIYTFQLDALTQAFRYRLSETVVIGNLLQCLFKWSPLFLFTENKRNVRRGQLHEGSRLPTVWEPLLTGFMQRLEFELRVCLALKRLCFVYIHAYIYIYIKRLTTFQKKETGVLTKWDNPCIFSHEHQKSSQAFFQGTHPGVSFMYRHSSSACSHVLSHFFNYLCMCTRNYYFDTLNLTLHYLRPLLLNYTLKKKSMNEAALFMLTSTTWLKKNNFLAQG